MYLFERTFALSIFCLCMLIVFIIIYNGHFKSLKKVLLIYTFVLGIMAFFFVPPKGADLFRIFRILDSYGEKSFGIIMNKYVSTKSTPLATLYYWFFAKINIKNLLPFFNTIVVYVNIFYILSDYTEKKKIDKRATALTFFLIMSSGFFMEVISGIRTMLAFSILARCFYDEIYNDKKIIKNIFYYIISFLIHSSAVGILLFRFIYFFIFENKNNILKNTFYIFLLLIVYYVFNSYILNSFDKLEAYAQNGDYFWIWEFIKITIMIFTQYIILSKFKKRRERFFNYLLIIFTISIMIISGEFNIYLRFNYFSLLLMIPIILDYYQTRVTSNTYSKSKNISIVFILSIVLLFISCSRGNLSSLKFFIFNRE